MGNGEFGREEGYGRSSWLAGEVSRRGAEGAEDQLPGSRCLIFTVARMAIAKIEFPYCFSAISAPLRELIMFGHEEHEESRKVALAEKLPGPRASCSLEKALAAASSTQRLPPGWEIRTGVRR